MLGVGILASTRAKSILLNIAAAAAVILPAFAFADLKGGFFFFNFAFVLPKLALSLLLPFFAALLCISSEKNTRALSVIMLLLQPACVLFTILKRNYYIHYSIDFIQYHYAYALLAFFAVFLAAVLAARRKIISPADFGRFCRRFFAGYLFLFVYLFAQLYILIRVGLTGGTLNFIPFAGEIRRTVQSLPAPQMLVRSVGNVLFYSSFSLLLWALFGGKIKGRAGELLLLIGCPVAVSLACEIVQGIMRNGNSDIDDLILNSLGAVIGFFAAQLLKKLTSEE